jgi:hypothetical protein
MEDYLTGGERALLVELAVVMAGVSDLCAIRVEIFTFADTN